MSWPRQSGAHEAFGIDGGRERRLVAGDRRLGGRVEQPRGALWYAGPPRRRSLYVGARGAKLHVAARVGDAPHGCRFRRQACVFRRVRHDHVEGAGPPASAVRRKLHHVFHRAASLRGALSAAPVRGQRPRAAVNNIR